MKLLRWHNHILWIVLATIVMVGTIFYSSFSGRVIALRFTPLQDAAMEIKFETTTAHLWFEEAISGDRYIDIEEIWKHLDEAEWYARAMLEGGENHEGKYEPLEDTVLRQGIEKTLEGINAFRALAKERWSRHLQSGIGSDIDQRFDKMFSDLLIAADDVETALQREMKRQMQKFNILQNLLIIFIIILGLIIATLLQRYERRRSVDLQNVLDKEENLRTTLNSIGDAVISTDASGHVIRMNPVAETLSGWKLSDAVGKHLNEIFHIINAKTKEPILNPVDLVLEKGKIVGLANHTLLIARNGTEYQIADSAAPIQDRAGNITGVVLVFRDVTDDYVLREALKTSETRFKRLFEKAPLGYQSLNIEGKFIEVNPAWLNMFGYTRGEVIGHEFQEFLVEDSFVETNLPRFIEAGEIQLPVSEIRCKDGSIKTIHIDGRIGYDKEEKFQQTHCLLTDVTERIRAEDERIRAEEKLKESEEKFRSIYLSANVAMIISIDNTGRIISWNPGAEKSFGYAENEILGQPLTLLMPERYREAHNAGLKRVVETGEYRVIGKAIELEGLHKDGCEFPLELSLGVWHSKEKIYFSAVIHDITDRKRAEEQLQTALVDAERANQAKSEFLATMSHEFRTPLNAILGFSEMLSAHYFGPLGADNYEIYANDIHTSGEHMLELVNDMLDIAAIEAGKRPMINEDVDVGEIVKDCVRNVEPAAQDSGIDLSLDVADDAPSIYADKRSVTQIVFNLLSNAIKFTERDGMISVSLTAADNKISIKVSDTGVGIPPDRLSTVTDPFSQTHSDPHITQQGTGLGLSIVKSLVENHSGKLNIESEVGKGTTVTVSFHRNGPL